MSKGPTPDQSAAGSKPASAPAALKFVYFLLRSVVFGFRVVRWVLLAAILSFFASVALGNFRDVGKNKALTGFLEKERALERPAIEFLQTTIPTNFKGVDVSRWMLLLGIYLASVGIGMGGERIDERAFLMKRRLDGAPVPRPQAASPVQSHHPPRGAQKPSKLERDAEGLVKGEKVDREKLLEIYAQAKKSLEQQKRLLSFLSIDVVDSTGMKKGEAPEIAELDFRQYKHLVEKALEENGFLKATWTPDGVMICFGSVLDSVRAAEQILTDLAEFNRKVKAIKADFKLRVGINAGEVSYDEDMKMEEMTDRVIDIAGHMQKHGAVDAVCISRQAIEPHLKEFSFQPAGREVDGCEVFEWRPNPTA